MKKFLALALTLALALALSIGVSADYVNVYGGDPGDKNFDSAASTQQVAITALSGDIEHRYAVDIEYLDLAINVNGGKMVWDAKNLTYVTETTGSGSNKQATINIKNRSDLSVWYSYNVVDIMKDDADNDGISFSSTTAMDEYFELEKATAATASQPGEAHVETITIDITAASWDAVATFYAGYFANKGVTSKEIATITVKFSKTNP